MAHRRSYLTKMLEVKEPWSKTALKLFYWICGGVLLIAVFLISGLVSQGRYIDIATFLIPLVIALATFLWSLASQLNGVETADYLRQSWSGRQVLFRNVHEHFGELRTGTDLTAANIERNAKSNDIDTPDILYCMISLLPYGAHNSLESLKAFVDYLDDWTKAVLTRTDGGQANLYIAMWSAEDQMATFADPERNSWRTDSARLAMIKRLCDVLVNIGRANTRISTHVYLVPRSDVRIFLAKSNGEKYYSQTIVFTPFVGDDLLNATYESVGFESESKNGYMRMLEFLHKARACVRDQPTDDIGRELFHDPAASLRRFLDLELPR